MQTLQLPPSLQPGQRIAVVAASGALREWERFEQGVQIWRDRGYEVVVPDELDNRWGYLAGTDDRRRAQLRHAWNDPDCHAIVFARGGYGAMRILEDWDWSSLPAHPKWTIGFSDLTSWLWGIAGNCRIAGIHGPVLTTLSQEPDDSRRCLFDWLEGQIDRVSLQGEGWGGGKARGTLLAGNLNLATHAIGTQLIPDVRDTILAFEDVSEPPYKVDRMLTHWRLTGLLRQVKGVALGRFTFNELPADSPSFSMEAVWRDRLGDLGIPIVSDLPFGHNGSNYPLAIGCQTELDGDRGVLAYWR